MKVNNCYCTLHFYDSLTIYMRYFFLPIFVSELLNSNIDTMNTIKPVSVGVRMCIPKTPTGNNNAISVDPRKRFRWNVWIDHSDGIYAEQW